MGKTIFIGDVHGCFDELLKLLEKVNFIKNEDRLIFIGDLVHKGPQSSKVIDFVFKNSFEIVLGNHDYFFLKALEGVSKPYEEFNQIISNLLTPIEEIVQWMKKIPYYIKDKKFLAIHAGLDPEGDCIKNNDANVCMNIRFWDPLNKSSHFMTDRERNNQDGLIEWYDVESKYFDQFESIIYGHSAKKEVQFSKNHRIIGIDTGCCYGGRLTAYILENNKFIQVESLQAKQFNY